jgi:hypothetical protein
VKDLTRELARRGGSGLSTISIDPAGGALPSRPRTRLKPGTRRHRDPMPDCP